MSIENTIKLEEGRYVQIPRGNDTRPVVVELEFENYKLQEKEKKEQSLQILNSQKLEKTNNESLSDIIIRIYTNGFSPENLFIIGVVLLVISYLLLTYIVIYDINN